MTSSRKPFTQRRYSNATVNQHADVSAASAGTPSTVKLFIVSVRSSNPSMGSVRIEAVYVPKTKVIDRSALSNKGYPAGTVLRLVAENATGCKFAGWNDGIPTATREITVKGNAEYVANFMSAGAEEPGAGAEVPGIGSGSGSGSGGSAGLGADADNTENTVARQTGIVAFVKKWWWAILLLACMIYDMKGGK